ncbi:MAG: hypothetical protein WED33_11030 [Bacteroidia bacterium]
MILFIAGIILFQGSNAQQVSISLTISESGIVEVEPFCVDGFNSFGGIGFTGNIFAIYQVGKFSKRKIKRQQKKYDRQVIIDPDSIENTELTKTEGLTFSPFDAAAASNSMSLFMPMMFMSAPDSGKVWSTFNYTTTNYNCRGGASYSSYFIRHRLNEKSFPDSIYWGYAYPARDSGNVEKPKSLWRYWYNEQDNFTRIEITDLDYPEEFGPNQLRTIISFDYNADNQLTRIITFQDTLSNSVCQHADSLSDLISKSFYYDDDSIRDFIEELAYPDSGQAVFGFIQYQYANKQLISSHSFTKDWLAIVKDSLVYEDNLLKEHYHLMDNSTYDLTKFSYLKNHRLNKYSVQSYVDKNDAHSELDEEEIPVSYIRRSELNLRNKQKAELKAYE